MLTLDSAVVGSVGRSSAEPKVQGCWGGPPDIPQQASGAERLLWLKTVPLCPAKALGSRVLWEVWDLASLGGECNIVW